MFSAQGFSVVEAADYSEAEKGYIFELATTVVLPIGAGMTNLIWAARGAIAETLYGSFLSFPYVCPEPVLAR